MKSIDPVRWRISTMTGRPRRLLATSHCSPIIFILLAALAAGCFQSAHPEEPVRPVTIDFDSAEVGKLPPDFTTALTGGGGPILWVVREDSQGTGGHKLLVQESSDDTSYRFPMCIYDKAVARDVSVEVKYKAISGSVDQAGGIVLRYSPENYYIARANVLEDNIDLFKTVNGKRLKIEEVTAKVSPGEWHTLIFEAKGPHLKVMFDGKLVIQTDDATFSEAGKIGLWTKADSVCAFRDLVIEPAP
jgi:3-keto-disaccharide hydrolase